MPPRLIDLHTDWLLQYAPETTLFESSVYPNVPGRLYQAEGYLQTTSAAVLACYRSADDWARQGDPWSALGSLITRIEAEFPGRLLRDSDDLVRWQADPEGLCWGLIGVEGFDALVRTPADLDRVEALFERGVRLFQPVYSATSLLGGCAWPEDDRGLTDLGRAFLETLAGVGANPNGPRPMLDLAHLNPRTASDVLMWFEADISRTRQVIPVYSHGALVHADFAKPRAITVENLTRLRSIGGWIGFCVGPPFYASSESLRLSIVQAASLPFLGRPGYEGIAIGTDFLGVNETLPGLSNASAVVEWCRKCFKPGTAASLIQGNAMLLIQRVLGGPSPAANSAG
jgi:membrane dipeptidase